MGNRATITAGKGEEQVTVDIPANGNAIIAFDVLKGQGLSSFIIHREKSPGLGDANLEANLSSSEENTFASATGRWTGSNQPHLNHSDTGVSNSLNLSPTRYYYLLSATDGKAHAGVVVGYRRP